MPSCTAAFAAAAAAPLKGPPASSYPPNQRAGHPSTPAPHLQLLVELLLLDGGKIALQEHLPIGLSLVVTSVLVRRRSKEQSATAVEEVVRSVATNGLRQPSSNFQQRQKTSS